MGGQLVTAGAFPVIGSDRELALYHSPVHLSCRKNTIFFNSMKSLEKKMNVLYCQLIYPSGEEKKILSRYSEKGSIHITRMRKPLRRAAGCDEEAVTFHGLWALSQIPLDYIHSSFFTLLWISITVSSLIL